MSYLMPEVISVFNSRHPSIRISLYEYETNSLIEHLASGKLDLVIDNLSGRADMMEPHYIGTEILLIAVPADSNLNNRLTARAYTYSEITAGDHLRSEPGQLRDLRPFDSQPFILLQEGYDTRKRCDRVFSDYGITPLSAYELNQLSSTFGMAASGLGNTVVSDTLVCHSPGWGPKMVYYTVRHPEFMREVYLYTLKNRMLSHAVKELINISKELEPLSISY